MKFRTTRIIACNVHIAAALYNLFFIYTTLHGWPYGLAVVQWVTFPLLVISGIWLRKGKKLWQLKT